MKATLKTFTALTVVLALSGEAGAQSNFSPMMKPNLTNLAKPNLVKPPVIISNGVKPINPNAVKPIVRPQVVRPAVAPRADVSRLAKKPEAQNRKKAERQARKQTPAKQVGTPIASIRELPPLPRSKPDRQVIAELPPLPRPKPNYDAGPQPEPPTLEVNAGTSGLPGSDIGALGQVGDLAGLEAMRAIVGDLALMQELARLGDLKELLGGNDAIDDGALGGGSGKHSGFGWEGLAPESNTGDAGPQNDKVWKPEAPGGSAYNRDPYGDHGGGFTPPKRGKRDGSNIPGFGQTPGSAGAGAGLRFGRGGETSQDYSGSGHVDNEDHGDIAAETGPGGSGANQYDDSWEYEDGTRVTVRTTRSGNGEKSEWRTFYPDGSIREDLRFYDKSGDVTYNHTRLWLRNPPTDQPNPEEAGSGQSMPCPKTSSGCGPSDGLMSYKPSKWDKVGQPGKGDDQGETPGFRASVAERKGVVTNPLPPDAYQARTSGGGRGPMPKEYVTQPGGGGPDGPPRP